MGSSLDATCDAKKGDPSLRKKAFLAMGSPSNVPANGNSHVQWR